MPNRPHEWIPYSTDRLRKLIKVMGFIASSFSADDGVIYYIHPTRKCSNPDRPEIGIVKINTMSRLYYLKIIDQLKEKYGYTDSEIEEYSKSIDWL